MVGSEVIVFKKQWQFNEKRGAILLMHKARETHVPEGFFDAASSLPVLQNKHIVCETWTCPGFYMYRSNKSGLL